MLSLMIACNTPRHATSPANSEVMPEDSPTILFLNYEIARDTENSAYSARLINKVAVNGTIKPDLAQAKLAEAGDLELQVLDKNETLLHILYIPDPLEKVVEFVNDRGELQKNEISLDIAEFSVRIQLEPGATTALLKRLSGPDTESILLVNTKLQ